MHQLYFTNIKRQSKAVGKTLLFNTQLYFFHWLFLKGRHNTQHNNIQQNDIQHI